MKNLMDIERRMTKLIAWSKSKKAGAHSGKNSRSEPEEKLACRKCWDRSMDEFRKELMDLREQLRNIIGRR